MKIKTMVLGLLASVCAVTAVKAEVEVSGGVDLVSDYVWRGVEQDYGAALQPGMSVSAGNFSVGAWGSTGFDSVSALKELDFTAGYAIGNLSLSLTDYWWAGQGGDMYFEGDNHQLEASISYQFGEDFPLAITWSTMLAGGKSNAIGEYDADGDRKYSTFIDIEYPFAVKSVDCSVAVGISPWESQYGNDGFDVNTVTATFSKNLVETDDFTLPIFVQTIFAPVKDDAFIVAGLSFTL